MLSVLVTCHSMGTAISLECCALTAGRVALQTDVVPTQWHTDSAPFLHPGLVPMPALSPSLHPWKAACKEIYFVYASDNP